MSSVVAVACVLAGARRSHAHPQSPSALVGRRAPKVIARDIRNKAGVKLESFRGRPLLLVFFATWCRPCRAIEPALEAFMRKQGPKRLALLALSHELRVRILRHARPHPAGYKVAQCTGRTALRYGALTIPTLVLIDAKGVVRGAWQDIKPYQLPGVLAVVAAAASGKSKAR